MYRDLFVPFIAFIMILGCEKKELKNQVHYLQDEVDGLEVEVKDLEKENKSLQSKLKNISDLEKELSNRIGLKTSIQFNEGGSSGSLTLYYSDLNQLDEIMKRLKK